MQSHQRIRDEDNIGWCSAEGSCCINAVSEQQTKHNKTLVYLIASPFLKNANLETFSQT